jgi:hypothetical protein
MERLYVGEAITRNCVQSVSKLLVIVNLEALSSTIAAKDIARA